jgi:hypothetical protein
MLMSLVKFQAYHLIVEFYAMQRVSLKEANELLKLGKILRQLGPEKITLRKLWKDCYHLVNEQQQMSSIIDGQTTVSILKSNTYYLDS